MAAGAALLAGGGEALAQPFCHEDADCGRGTCARGLCVSPSVGAEPAPSASARAAPRRAAPAPVPAASPGSVRLGELGESCRARADCADGLRCVATICRSPLEGQSCTAAADCGPHLRCRANVCVAPPGALPAGANAPGGVPSAGGPDYGTPAPVSGLARFRRRAFVGTHPFVGITLGGAPIAAHANGETTAEGAFLFAFQGGVLINKLELALELAPASLILFRGFGGQKGVSLTATVGGYPSITGNVYWPLRFGVGYFGAPDFDHHVQVRCDLLGVAWASPWVIVEFDYPSFRYFFQRSGEFSAQVQRFVLMLNLKVSFVF